MCWFELPACQLYQKPSPRVPLLCFPCAAPLGLVFTLCKQCKAHLTARLACAPKLRSTKMASFAAATADVPCAAAANCPALCPPSTPAAHVPRAGLLLLLMLDKKTAATLRCHPQQMLHCAWGQLRAGGCPAAHAAGCTPAAISARHPPLASIWLESSQAATGTRAAPSACSIPAVAAPAEGPAAAGMVVEGGLGAWASRACMEWEQNMCSSLACISLDCGAEVWAPEPASPADSGSEKCALYISTGCEHCMCAVKTQAVNFCDVGHA